MSRHRIALVLVTGILIGISLSLGASVLAARKPAASSPVARATEGLSWEDARLLAEVLHRVETEYVDAVDEHGLIEQAVRGVMGSLDAHSTFLDRDEYEEMQASTAGSYPGIGIEVEPAAGGVKVVHPVEGAPAQVAGVRSGDLIIDIDGEDVGTDVDRAIVRMRGRAGTMVRIGVQREGAPKRLEFAIRRTQVEVHSVASQLLEPGYGYLRILQFSETTQSDVERAVKQLKQKTGDATLAGLVVDLRNNPGGLLDSAVEIADDFLDRGTIVSAEGRTEDSRFRMEAAAGDLLPGTALVVLVNGGSASAAEILAGALRDNRRATLVGRKTYGKGSVQTIMPLSDGQAIKLTTSRYFTPSGASINEIGLQPDVVFTGDDQDPADVDPPGIATPTLATRDAAIRFALGTLKVAPRMAGTPPVAIR